MPACLLSVPVWFLGVILNLYIPYEGFIILFSGVHILRLGKNTRGKNKMTLSQPSDAPNRILLRASLLPLPLIDLLLLFHLRFMYPVLRNDLPILFRPG